MKIFTWPERDEAIMRARCVHHKLKDIAMAIGTGSKNLGAIINRKARFSPFVDALDGWLIGNGFGPPPSVAAESQTKYLSSDDAVGRECADIRQIAEGALDRIRRLGANCLTVTDCDNISAAKGILEYLEVCGRQKNGGAIPRKDTCKAPKPMVQKHERVYCYTKGGGKRNERRE